jgi:hypothetical protein
MKEEWNKGYEKGRDDYCCNNNCNQGRDCPLRNKELTDEEIKSEAKYFCHSWYSQNPERLVLFAKAILRKAQEK